VFTPTVDVIYPDGFDTQVRVGKLGDLWEGASRPGHFDGVATVVLKLFTITEPDAAVFGQKDFQQFAVIKRLVADFNLPVRLIRVATVRESDGLALSSRNAYLDQLSRQAATSISQALQKQIERSGVFELDYVGFCDPETLVPIDPVVPPLVILTAATCRAKGAARDRRFIDNVLIR
jgi:pantoate--beta-alanine ligase